LETEYPATVEGLRDAAKEIAETATSTESVPGGKGGEHLLEVPSGDTGDVGMPPQADDELSLKDAAKRLAQHREDRERDRENLNKAIGLDDEHDDLRSHYEAMKRSVKEAEDALGIKDERAEKLAELEKAQAELRSQIESQRQSEPQPHVEQAIRHNAEAGRQQILSAYLQQVPEAANPQAWAALEANNPARAAAAKQLFAQYDGIYRQHLNELSVAIPQHLEMVRAHNAQFDKDHPELRDPKVRGEIQNAAVRVLKKAGATDADIDQLRVNGMHHVAQDILARAAKFELAADTRAKNAGRRKVPPAPQRPGVAGAPMSKADTAFHAASRAMDSAPSVKNAARMLAAMRRSRS
jgi:hypothetical protein